MLMKRENEYQNVIHDMGCDPFFIYYYCAEQIHLYRGYCNSTDTPKLIIDATGSIVKPFHKFGIDKTKSIYSYEALVYDKEKNQNFTVTNMVSERHTNIAISNWLLQWITSDIKKPKDTVCDNSLALLSAMVQSFTQYSSLQDYVRACSDLLTKNITSDSHWVPRCFIKIDVAHFIKICSKWTPLKTVPPRVREIILRAMCLIIKCQSLTEVRSLLFSIFVVFINETDGINVISRQETDCEVHKKRLIEATSSGFIHCQKEFDDLRAVSESEDETRNALEEMFEEQNEGLNDHENPFKSWAENIYDTIKSLVHKGSGINPLFIPTLVPILIK